MLEDARITRTDMYGGDMVIGEIERHQFIHVLQYNHVTIQQNYSLIGNQYITECLHLRFTHLVFHKFESSKLNVRVFSALAEKVGNAPELCPGVGKPNVVFSKSMVPVGRSKQIYVPRTNPTFSKDSFNIIWQGWCHHYDERIF